MNYPQSAIWSELTEAQRTQIVVMLVQILLRHLRQKEKEVSPDDKRNAKG